MSIPSTSRKTMKIYTTNSDELDSRMPQKKGRKNIRRSTLRKMIERMSEMFKPNTNNKVHTESTTRKSTYKSSPQLTRKRSSSLDSDNSSLKLDYITLTDIGNANVNNHGGRTRRRRKGTKKRR